jgi:hypothetical protein
VIKAVNGIEVMPDAINAESNAVVALAPIIARAGKLTDVNNPHPLKAMLKTFGASIVVNAEKLMDAGPHAVIFVVFDVCIAKQPWNAYVVPVLNCSNAGKENVVPFAYLCSAKAYLNA